MNEIYLDNAATTKTYAEVNDAITDTLINEYGNSSSLHNAGMRAENIIKQASKTIADTIGAEPGEIFYTSGGTESDNMALIGYAEANKKRGRHIISTCVEHPAVLEALSYLEKNGFEVDCLSVDDKGNISLDELDSLLRADTILVSVMLVNNEVGTLMPIDALKKHMKAKSPEAALHVDAVQGYGKIPINVKKSGIDMLSISSHKIHGPKGVGVLYIKKGVRVAPLMFGGHHQGGMRPGTMNTPGICGFAKACEIMNKNLDANYNKVSMLKKMLWDGICENIENAELNGDIDSCPYILNVSFLGIKAEILLHSLEAEGIYVSTGSACSSNKPQPSNTLTKMGKNKKQIEGAVRFSLSDLNSEEEIKYTISKLTEKVSEIRKFVRG